MITTLDNNTILLSKDKLLKIGKELILVNSFYFTSHLLLKYYFVKHQDFYLMNFIKDITHSENEFKVFMIYIEFALYTYNSKIKELFCDDENDENTVYILIAYVKHIYDNDHTVLKPFINSITENEDEIIFKFNAIKSVYNFKLDAIQKFGKLNLAISYLEKSKEYENKAKKYSNMALDHLSELKDQFRKTIYNNEQDKFLIKNL